MTSLLKDAYDMHVHPAPDVVARKQDDVELAKDYVAAGMKGFVIKSHYFNTEGRAYHLRKQFPGFNAVGALVLNNSVGGLNPYAVQQAGNLGTKMLFMPTMDAQNMWDYLAASKEAVPFGSNAKSAREVCAIQVCKNGILDPAVENILDLVKQHDMVLCTGHISPSESLALLKRAHEKGLKKLVTTHVEWRPTHATAEQMEQYIKYGAFLEFNVANIMNGTITVKKLVEHIKDFGAEHVFISTDLGQAINPAPVKCFEEYINKLIAAGITKSEMHKMIVENPAYLVE